MIINSRHFSTLKITFFTFGSKSDEILTFQTLHLVSGAFEDPTIYAYTRKFFHCPEFMMKLKIDSLNDGMQRT